MGAREPDRKLLIAVARAARAVKTRTGPGPGVGVALSRGGRIVARAAGPWGQAPERVLLDRAARTKGAILCVSLAPVGRDATRLVERLTGCGLAAIVVGAVVPGRAGQRGLERLSAVAPVRVGPPENPACGAHRFYLHLLRFGRPFVSLKVATSLDGRVATAGGDSKWITGEPARTEGHRLRATHQAVAVGAETIVSDDPRLDTRLVRGPDPTPVLFDSKLRTTVGPPRQVLRTGTLALHVPGVSQVRLRRVVQAGAHPVEVAPDGSGRIDPRAALDELSKRGIDSLLIEGGGTLIGAFVRAGLWDRLHHFVAPVMLGDGRPMIAGVGWETVRDAPRLAVESRRRFGADHLTIYRPD